MTCTISQRLLRKTGTSGCREGSKMVGAISAVIRQRVATIQADKI